MLWSFKAWLNGRLLLLRVGAGNNTYHSALIRFLKGAVITSFINKMLLKENM
jgi:hypothetical protein